MKTTPDRTTASRRRTPGIRSASQKLPAPAGPCASKRGDGFTMVELLITMLLLSIVLLGLAALQVATIRQVTSSRRANEAMRLGQSMVEQHQRMDILQIAAITPLSAWNTMLKKDQATQMVQVGVDGESNGPFTVERMVERSVLSGVTYYLITFRVTWLDIVPGAEADPTQRYRTLTVMMSCRRGL